MTLSVALVALLAQAPSLCASRTPGVWFECRKEPSGCRRKLEGQRYELKERGYASQVSFLRLLRIERSEVQLQQIAPPVQKLRQALAYAERRYNECLVTQEEYDAEVKTALDYDERIARFAEMVADYEKGSRERGRLTAQQLDKLKTKLREIEERAVNLVRDGVEIAVRAAGEEARREAKLTQREVDARIQEHETATNDFLEKLSQSINERVDTQQRELDEQIKRLEERISALERAQDLAAAGTGRDFVWILTGSLSSYVLDGAPAVGAALHVEALLPGNGLGLKLQPFGGVRGVLWNPSRSTPTFPGQVLTYERKDEFVELEAGVKRYGIVWPRVYALASVTGVVQPEGKRRLGFSVQLGGGVLLYPGNGRIGLEVRSLAYRTASRDVRFDPFSDAAESYPYRWNIGATVGVMGSLGVL